MLIDPKLCEKRSIEEHIFGIIASDPPFLIRCSLCMTHYCNEHENTY